MPKIVLNEEQKKLVEDNIALVHFTLRKHFSASLAKDEDIISAGYEGLCIAAGKYDPERGAFSSLAVQCIRNLIRTELYYRSKHRNRQVYVDNTITDDDDMTFGKWQGSDDGGFGEVDTLASVEHFSSFLTTTELAVVRMRMADIPTKEIIKRTGLGKTQVYKIINETKDLWESYKGDDYEK